MSTTVNVPTNPGQRDHDVENKLRLYGIYEGKFSHLMILFLTPLPFCAFFERHIYCSDVITAFSHGKLPSNRQIDVALTSFLNHNKLQNPDSNLSSEGRVILEDFRNVVEEARRLLLLKNHDHAIQEFIWNATQLGHSGVPANTPGAPVDKDAARGDGQRGVEGLKTLGQLIITNG